MTRPAGPAYDEVYVWSMTRPGFLLQHVVDAYAAWSATAATTPMKLAFALVGLHLHVDHGFDGFTVQRVHMRMGEDRREWPRFPIPEQRADVGPHTVLAAPAGPERDAAVDHWSRAVWGTYAGEHPAVAALASPYLQRHLQRRGR